MTPDCLILVVCIVGNYHLDFLVQTIQPPALSCYVLFWYILFCDLYNNLITNRSVWLFEQVNTI